MQTVKIDGREYTVEAQIDNAIGQADKIWALKGKRGGEASLFHYPDDDSYNFFTHGNPARVISPKVEW